VLAGEASQLLTAIQQPFAVLSADSGPFLRAVSENPDEISQLLSGLDDWANSWIAAEASGPYLALSQNEVVANPADLGMAVLGGPEAAAYLSAGLGPGYVDPPTYSDAGSIPTGASTSSVLTSTRRADSTPAPVIPEPTQARAVSRIVSAMTGRTPASPAVSTLLLSPVLEDLVAHS
jgi:hypothetical protein